MNGNVDLVDSALGCVVVVMIGCLALSMVAVTVLLVRVAIGAI